MLAFCYVSVNIAHTMLVSIDNAEWYFLSSALADLLVLTLISRIDSDKSLPIVKLCIISIVANSAAWMMWYKELDLTAYAAVMIAIYIYAIIILTSRDSQDVGLDTRDWGGVWFFSDSHSSLKSVFKHKS